MDIIVTGAAGFIGFHLSRRLIMDGHTIIGIDNVNDYYDVKLKEARLAQLADEDTFTFYRQDIAERAGLDRIFADHKADRVIHLAAQAGVRYSIDNPHAYVQSNLVGFVNILEACRQQESPHLVYASSSSVYGNNHKVPFSETDSVDNPISLYAATKKSNELMAYTYSHLYRLPTTGLRFFTVYGPWGRPDMAYFKFADAICRGDAIDVYNYGDMQRDFTYIDDIVEGIVRIMNAPRQGDGAHPPYQLFNIGNDKPVQLTEFIDTLIDAFEIKSKIRRNMKPMQPGDVKRTHANIDRLNRLVNYRPTTSLQDGLREFASWYNDYKECGVKSCVK